jgi:uncharacterized membrane protein
MLLQNIPIGALSFLLLLLIEGVAILFHSTGNRWPVGILVMLIAAAGMLWPQHRKYAIALGTLLLALLGVHYAVDAAALFDAVWYLGPVVIFFLSFLFRNTKDYQTRMAFYLGAWLYAIAGIMNSLNAYDIRSSYLVWGFPIYWNYVTALYEILVGALLLIPQTRRLGLYAATALLVLICGVLVYHGNGHKFFELGSYLAVTALLWRALKEQYN